MLLGSFRTEPYYVFLATAGVILAAAYMLWANQRILFNQEPTGENATLRDLNWRELGLLSPLVLCIIWLGVYPAPLLRRTEPSAERFVHQVEHGYASAHPAPPRRSDIEPPKRGGR